jgi:hypothetical protein
MSAAVASRAPPVARASREGAPGAKARPGFKLTHPVPPEHELQVAVGDALRVLLPGDAVFTSWDLAGFVSAAEGARKKRRHCLAGWPDMGVAWRSRLVLIELKRSRYGVLSKAQRELHPRLENAGFPVEVCCSVEDVLETVSRAGIPLRGRVA